MSSIEKALQTQGSGTKGDKRAALLALQAVLVDEAKTPDDNDNLSNLVKSEEDRKALKDFATAALPAALSAANFGSHVYSIGKVLGPLMENAETLLGNQKVVIEQVLSIYRKAEEVAAINDKPSTSGEAHRANHQFYVNGHVPCVQPWRRLAYSRRFDCAQRRCRPEAQGKASGLGSRRPEDA